MEKEIRNINVEVRKNDAGTITGYALTFNEPYSVGDFVEQIAPEAMQDVLARSDVFALLNHDINRGVLARSNRGEGNLKLTCDSRGLVYEFKSGKSALHQELNEYLDNGIINTSSFSFSVAEDGDSFERLADGKYLRTITQFNQLYDVSPVFQPANPNTSVSSRSAEKIAELKAKDLLEFDFETEKESKEAERKAQKKREFDIYYKNLVSKYK